jgi:heat shock protein HtpX
MNRMKTFVLLSALSALLVFGGQALGGRGGAMIAVVMAFAMNFFAYWFSDKFVLRMYHAQEITPAQAPGYFAMVQRLVQKANLPMPKLYVIPEHAPNAFATGRNPQHGVVAVTQGLLEMLDEDEIEGVVAHELAHIKHRDTLLMSVAATIVGALSNLANFAMWGAMFGGRSDDDEGGGGAIGAILVMVMAMFTAPMIQMAISRAREFMADEFAAKLTGRPMSLAGALKRIEGWSARVPMHSGSPETAHLFIQNPFSGQGLAALFRTHPTTEDRVKRLQALASSVR